MITNQDIDKARELLQKYPITEEERSLFLKSERGIKRILGIDRFKDAKIVVTIVKSSCCIAGHKQGDRIIFDSMGRLLMDEVEKPVCICLLNMIWYRIIHVLDRMADDEKYIRTPKEDFKGELPEVHVCCLGVGLPEGNCGSIWMQISVER